MTSHSTSVTFFFFYKKPVIIWWTHNTPAFLQPCVNRSTYLVSGQSINLEHAVGCDVPRHTMNEGIIALLLCKECGSCVLAMTTLLSLSDLARNSLMPSSFFFLCHESISFLSYFFSSPSPFAILADWREQADKPGSCPWECFCNYAARYPSSEFISRESIHSSAWLYWKKK